MSNDAFLKSLSIFVHSSYIQMRPYKNTWNDSSMRLSNRTSHSSLRCCHISPDSANGQRTDRKNAKNDYPVEKVVSVAMKVVAEGVRSA